MGSAANEISKSNLHNFKIKKFREKEMS